MDREPSDRLKKAVTAHQKAKDAEDQARQQVYAAILEDLANGVRQADIVRTTGYTREHIRQIVLADKKKRATDQQKADQP